MASLRKCVCFPLMENRRVTRQRGENYLQCPLDLSKPRDPHVECLNVLDASTATCLASVTVIKFSRALFVKYCFLTTVAVLVVAETSSPHLHATFHHILQPSYSIFCHRVRWRRLLFSFSHPLLLIFCVVCILDLPFYLLPPMPSDISFIL